MTSDRPRALLSWSSGKDSAWALEVCRQRDDYDIVGLVTTLNEDADRVAMHAVRHVLLRRQAKASGLPLYVVGLPSPCSNEVYEARLGGTLECLRGELGVTHMVFGDLHLEDIRKYRETQMEALGLEPVFPIWKEPTGRLARDMIEGGLEAWLTCVDTEQLPGGFCGRRFDAGLLAELPEGVDPCGENGEFHTLAVAGPMFSAPIAVKPGERHDDGRFVYADFLPAD